jgi:protein-tyrosine phosphatase
MTRLLFVCLGNICRSPTAEAVMQAKIADAGLEDQISCDSAGTIGYHAGDRADARMREHGSRRGYNLLSRSRKVRAEDFEAFDHIFAMDDDNLHDLLKFAGPQRDKVRRMVDCCTRHSANSVPDPYYGGAAGFEQVLDLLEDACDNLLAELRSSLAN